MLGRRVFFLFWGGGCLFFKHTVLKLLFVFFRVELVVVVCFIFLFGKFQYGVWFGCCVYFPQKFDCGLRRI